MLQRPEISKQDSKTLTSFYWQVRMAAGGDPQALGRAQGLISECSRATQRIGWTDVYEQYATERPKFLHQVELYYDHDKDFVPRAMNRMIQKLGKADFQGMHVRYREPGMLQARRWAIESAMSSLLSDDDHGAKTDLIAITSYARTCEDIKLLREGWLLTVNKQEDGTYQADKSAVDRLAQTLFKFQQSSARRSDVAASIAKLRESLDVLEADKDDEPIGSLTRGEAAAKLAGVMAEDGGLRLVMDSAKLRVRPYGRTVDRVMAHSAVKRVLRFIRREMADAEDTFARRQLVQGGVVMTPKNIDAQAVGHAYAKPLFDLTQSVAKKLGFTKDVTVVLATSIAPNAFVYTADVDKPRVTIFTSMVQKFWDFEKNDWLTLTLDADGKPAAPGDKGAHEVPVGKLLTESVLAHELGHIRDEAMLTRKLLIYLFLAEGQNLANKIENPDEKQRAQQWLQRGLEELQPWQCWTLGEKRANAEAGVSGLDLASWTRSARKAFDEAGVKEAQLQSLTDEILQTVPTVGLSDDQAFSVTFGDLFRFIDALMKVSRAAEETADRYAVIAQKTPQWTAVVDAMLGSDIHSPGSEAEKRQTIEGILKLDPQAFAAGQLRDVGDYEKEYTPDTSWIASQSHPVFVSRVMQDFDFADDKDGMAARMKKWDALPVEDRLLTMLKLHEKRYEGLRKSREALKPHESYSLTTDYIQRSEYDVRMAEIEDEMSEYLDLADALVGPSGLLDPNNAFVKRALEHIRGKALDLTERGEMFVLAKRWRDQLNDQVKAKTLTDLQRETATTRLETLNRIVKDSDKD